MAGKTDIDEKLDAVRNRSAAPKVEVPLDLPPPHGYLFLDLLKKNGNRWGFPYGGLSSQHLDNEKGVIVLRFTFQEVKIKGRALGDLYDRILNRAIGVVQEDSGNVVRFSREADTVIESIDVVDVG